MQVPFKVTCSSCSKQLLIKKQELIGRRLKCPNCGTPLLIEPDQAEDDPFEEEYGSYSDDYTDDEWGDDDDIDSSADYQPAQLPRRNNSRASSKRKKSASKQQKQDDSRPAWMLPAIIGGSVFGLVALISVVVLMSGGGAEADNESVETTIASTETDPVSSEPIGLRDPNATDNLDSLAHEQEPPMNFTPTAQANARISQPNVNVPKLPEFEVRVDNAIEMPLCLCPAGEFPYGPDDQKAEFPVAFWMGQTEVTRGQWRAVMQTEPWTKSKTQDPGDQQPAAVISWKDAVGFCKTLTKAERDAGRLTEELEYRLPTEAEWTYAFRAPRLSPQTGKRLTTYDYAWLEKNSGGRTHDVATKPHNVWGIHDLEGNVSEWTLDRFGTEAQARQNVYGGPNPFQWYDPKPGLSPLHMILGRSSAKSFKLIREGNAVSQGAAYANYGFRVVLAQPAVPTQAPDPSLDKVWVVLSGLDVGRHDPDDPKYKVTVDWKLVQGKLRPGKQYQLRAEAKNLYQSYVGTLLTAEVDLNKKQGTAEFMVPGDTVFSTVIAEEKPEDEAFGDPVSGELKSRGPRASAAKPPKR